MLSVILAAFFFFFFHNMTKESRNPAQLNVCLKSVTRLNESFKWFSVSKRQRQHLQQSP